VASVPFTLCPFALFSGARQQVASPQSEANAKPSAKNFKIVVASAAAIFFSKWGYDEDRTRKG